MMLNDDQEIILEICDYAKKYEIKALLQEYLKRVIQNKPEDPVRFLYHTIKENAYTPPKPFEVVFVLGGPGSGKGTNSSKIVQSFGYVHLSAGDLLREEREKKSATSEVIEKYIKEGKIVPAEITVKLLHQAMEKSGHSKFLIDGFPRDMSNLQCWLQLMSPMADVQFVLNLSCPDKVLLNRLLERGKTSGRVDDNIESTNKRFATYQQDTMEIIEYYRSEGKLREVDSNRHPDVVFNDVMKLFLDK